MSQTISLWGATYQNVGGVDLPKSPSGTARFTDVTDTTATASDVASGKYFYTANGTRTQGSASGGGGATIASTTKTVGSSNATSLAFTISGQPKMFAIMVDQQSSISSTRYIVAVDYDGTTTRGTWAYYSGQTRNIYYSNSYFSWTYSNGTLTVRSSSSSNGGYFRANYVYRIIYAY